MKRKNWITVCCVAALSLVPWVMVDHADSADWVLVAILASLFVIYPFLFLFCGIFAGLQIKSMWFLPVMPIALIILHSLCTTGALPGLMKELSIATGGSIGLMLLSVLIHYIVLKKADDAL